MKPRRKVLGYTLAFIANPGQQTFKAMAEAVSKLPADGGKVHTWPIVTLLPFLADPKRFIAAQADQHRRDRGAHGRRI